MSDKRNDKIWVFNAGGTFAGNPKWLFMYILENRKDIKPYWLCYGKRLLLYMRQRGYKAYLYKSRSGRRIMSRAGVYVVEQQKEVIEPELKGVKILNLWHGVGCKTVEKKVDFGFLNLRISKKYIRNNYWYKNYTKFLVTSPLMEKHFIGQIGLDDSQLIRAGYPRCIPNPKVRSFDHDILKQKGLPADTRIVVYAPTYRDFSQYDFFGKAIPDMKRLIQALEKSHLLLIFKMHPLMSQDPVYQEAVKIYASDPHVMFWDNKNDIYEIFDQIDTAIIDYSSIFYDMLAGGVKHFIRYMFDIDEKENLRDFVFDVREMTYGYDCKSFSELTETLEHYDECITDEDTRERDRIYDLFWQYARTAGNEEIINAMLEFKPDPKPLPTLYSYDIFDTLFGRKGLIPESIFFEVQERITKEIPSLPDTIIYDFPRIRKECESNVREWYLKTLDVREGNRLEITLHEIYERMQTLYHVTPEQTDVMERIEQECEIENVVPYTGMINEVKDHLAKGDDVILISDMYLPKETIVKMLEKADPVLATLPLYLSTEYGVQKTTDELFLTVFHDLDYKYGKWIHSGDKAYPDKLFPEYLGIHGVLHDVPEFNDYEIGLVDDLCTYEGYLAAALMARFRAELKPYDSNEEFAYCYASLYFVPYIAWVLKDAVKRGYKTLYFISRDGYHLKRIADAIIEVRHYPVRTKYIYGSRKLWRVPSFVHEIDDEFFSPFGNFAGVRTYDKLLEALDLDEAKFMEFFPDLAYLKNSSRISWMELDVLRDQFSGSKVYRDYILEKSAEEREIILKYLRQEINFDEPFAFPEYWGRGYTQDCLGRLLNEAAGREVDNPFYYMRSIYPTEGRNIRHNFTSNSSKLIFVEAIFANLPYKSVKKYQEVNGRVEPVLVPCENDQKLHESLERNLVRFAKDLYSNQMLEEDRFEKESFDYALDYINEHPTEPMILDHIAHLRDAVNSYGEINEFAPAVTMKSILYKLKYGEYFPTGSLDMSLARSNAFYRFAVNYYENRKARKVQEQLKK